MISWTSLTLAAFLGVCLGIFYFGSLWVTLRQLPTTLRPTQLFVGSYLGRLTIAGVGFYLLADGSWQRSVAGLLGFIVARTISIGLWGPRRPC